jgi:phage terminase large subunit GpA-like protein
LNFPRNTGWKGEKKRVDEAVLYESPTSDTLTTPFIKRKINNKRMCTMKLENIKQTKTEMTNYATRRACKMNLFI